MGFERLNLTEIEDLYTTKKGCFGELVNILSLPSMVVFVVILGFLDVISFKIEYHTLGLIALIYFIFLFFVKHNATIAVCRFETNFDILKLRIKEFLNDRAFKISHTSKALASMDDFFDNYKKSIRNDNFSSIASSVFPTLGILGTFISIAISMPDFSSNETTAFENEITMLLGGIATAFYVSIYGIFLSLWWIFFEKNGISRFEEDIKDLKRICNKYTWKEDEIELAKFEEEQNRHKELVGAVSKFGSDDFIKDFNEVISERMKLFEDLVSNESKIFKESSSILQETSDYNKKNMQLHREFIQSEESLSNSIKEIGLSLNKAVELLNHLMDKINSKEETLTLVLDNFANNSKIISNNIALQKENLSKQKDNLFNTIKEINSKMVEFKESNIILNKEFLKSFNEFNKNFESSSKNLVRAFETPSVENIKHIYSMLLKEFESLNLKIEKIPQVFDNKIDSFDKNLTIALKNSLQEMDSELADIVEKLAIVLKSIDASSKRISNSLK